MTIITAMTVLLFGAIADPFDNVFAKKDTALNLDNFEARTINGTGNNQELGKEDLGMAGHPLIRNSPAFYVDGISEPISNVTVPDRKNARDISNIVFQQDSPIAAKEKISDMIWAWAQFLTHDTNHTPDSSSELFNIEIPDDDPVFDNTIYPEIPFKRSMHSVVPEMGTAHQQFSDPTAYIDASMVYGSDQARSDALRTFADGKMKTSTGNLLPLYPGGFPNGPCTSAECFFTGDARANEQLALLTLHNLFVREHNRLAENIAENNRGLSDEEIYQISRKIVGAEIQVITYKEFIPKLLGQEAIPKYNGYDSSVNPEIATEFSTVAFREQHGQITPDLLRITNSGDVFKQPLSETSFRPDNLAPNGSIDSILRGLAAQRAEETDTKMVDGLRNILFGSTPASGGIDLAAFDIQRGRDHGVADYNTVRDAYGLERVTSFDQISSDSEVVEQLEEAYDSVDNIDAFVGGLAEDHLEDSTVGETFQEILVDQFIRLRDGDRFWYQNDPLFDDNKTLKQMVWNTSLDSIIKSNTDVDKIQKNVFQCSEPKIKLLDTKEKFCNQK